MALPNRALRLTLLAALACGGSQAQKITREDSVLLFHTAASPVVLTVLLLWSSD